MKLFTKSFKKVISGKEVLRKAVIGGIGGLVALSLAACSAYIPGNFSNVEITGVPKEGVARCIYILGFIGPFGKCTIGKAAKNGNLTAIQSVDFSNSYYILFGVRRVEVRGK